MDSDKPPQLERRKNPRRTKKDRREDIRFEPKKQNRRTNARREEDKNIWDKS